MTLVLYDIGKGGQQGLAAEWINANYRQEMLPTASLDAAAVQHGGSTDTLSGSQARTEYLYTLLEEQSFYAAESCALC